MSAKPIDDVFEQSLTDASNAATFAEHFRFGLAWVPEAGRWRFYREHTWQDDESGEAERCAITVANSHFDRLRYEDDRARAMKQLTHARRSANRQGITSMLELAKSCGMTVPEREWNRDPYLLGTPNGVVDLRTGQLRAGSHRDYISKRTGTPYSAEALCPQWIAFLDRIMDGNVGMIEFLQRAVGYSLTGDTSEQCLFLCHGHGANGKSKFITTLNHTLGDYARTCPAESLLGRRDGAIPNDIARLVGARMVTAIETEDGRRFAEAMVKALTGGDTITARFLHREFFEFVPVLKLWLATNHKPTIKGDDLAIWRRIRLIPFDVTIPDEEQDKELGDKLKAESRGILAWAVRGCLAWQRDGLQPPQPVVNATASYRCEQDQVGAWLDEECVVTPSATAQALPLYRNYAQWAEERGERGVLSQTMLGRKLGERGFTKHKSDGRMVYAGIGLKAAREAEGGSEVISPFFREKTSPYKGKPEIDSNHPSTLPQQVN